jgi:hypothetical protein
MNPEFSTYGGVPIKDRTTKVAKRRGQMKLNGRALKRLLNERATKAQHSQHTPKG